MLSNLQPRPPRKLNDDIMIIDGTNTFIRNFAFIKALNVDGHHIGGMVGFLKSLGFLVRTFDPTRVIIVFDGKGGSTNRKSIDPEYKANRHLHQITNWGMFDSQEEESISMTTQMDRLYDYLQCLPIHTITLEKLEADDIMAYLCLKLMKSGKKARIVSTDKDFFQFVSPNIRIFSPVKKVNYTVENVKEAIMVSPANYIIVKALLGDTSDNLAGVKGIGIKTLVKEFPELVEDTQYDLDFIYKKCEEKLGSKKLFANIIHEWDKVERNYQLMDLNKVILDEREEILVHEIISSPIPPLKSGAFLHLLDIDKIEGLTTNTESWLQIFSTLEALGK